MGLAGSGGSGNTAPWRVFLSHTSELRDFPKATSYVAAAERAISAAGHVIVNMADFPAADQVPGQVCAERVRGCDVYVGVLGTRYGSPVRDSPEVSYTELEFNTATEAGLDRLVFLLDTDAADVGIPLSALIDSEYGARQQAFRRGVQDIGLVTGSFSSPPELGQLVERSLRNLAEARARSSVAVTWHEESTAVSADRRLEEAILHFDLEALTRDFVGRSSVFARIDAFAATHRCGYVEVVGEAGLGKTALAAQIAKRQAAIVFIASVSSGTREPGQFLEHVCSELIARYRLERATLPGRLDSNVLLSRLLAEAAARAGPVWLVVDGLDEAEPPPSGANPLLLPTILPDGVFAVVTRRDGELHRMPGMPWLGIRLARDDREQARDIETLLRNRVERDPAVARAIADARPAVTVAEFVGSLRQASEGNFMYLTYLLDELAERGVASLRLQQPPQGLGGYYERFWDELSVAVGSGDGLRANLYESVLGFLAAAQEPVPAVWLASLVGRRAADIENRVLRPWSWLLGRDEAAGQVRWRLVHRSFAEYLDGPIDLQAAHLAIARQYVSGSDDSGFRRTETWDAYGLRHGPVHLAEAARRSNGPQRDELVEALARLVTDDRLLVRQLQVLRDPDPSQRHLTIAHRLLAGDASPRRDVPLVEVALAQLRLRRSLLQHRACTSLFPCGRHGRTGRVELA